MLGSRSSRSYAPSMLITQLLSIPLPIVEIIFGVMYPHDHNCDSFVGVSDWLIIKGSMMLATTFSGVLLFGFTNHAALTDSKSSAISALFCFVFYVLGMLFKTAWLIVGSVMFWRDCKDVTPSSLNDMMWASLIIGYINLCVNYNTSKSKD